MKILKKIGNFVFPVLLILSLVSISTVDVFAAAEVEHIILQKK